MEIVVALFVLLVAGYFLYNKYFPPVSATFVDDGLKTLKDIETKVEAEIAEVVEEIKAKATKAVEEVKVEATKVAEEVEAKATKVAEEVEAKATEVVEEVKAAVKKRTTKKS
jgi:hypothetical protein